MPLNRFFSYPSNRGGRGAAFGMWFYNGIPRRRSGNVRVRFQRRSRGHTSFPPRLWLHEAFFGKKPMQSLMSSSKMTRILHISLARCFSSGKAIIDSQHGGGTSTTTTPMRRVGMLQWIVLLSTLGDAPVYSSMQWATLIGKHISFVFQINPFFWWVVPHIHSLRLTEHDYVKANIPAKLLQICTFGRLELLTFKDLISPADYKACKKTKESRPSWYNLTADVFIEFFYKVWFMHSILFIFQPR